MVKLTRELINRSPQYRNPLKDREIDLRGNKITILENLGVTQDQFDSMDLSDNDLKRLDGFPNLRRLKLLIVCNNHISRVSEQLVTALPHLERLVLTNNNLRELSDLLPITKLRTLKSLMNPVTNNQHYRSFVIHHMPYLRLLDCQKTKEIDEAGRKFSGVEGLKLMKYLIETQTRYILMKFWPRIKFDEAETVAPAPVPQQDFVNERTISIKNAIKNAKTLDEMRSLESMLKSGSLPGVEGTSQ